MAYSAKQGDIIWLNLDPQAGHEQKGRRPAVVISNDTFNRFTKTGAMICPITNIDRDIPIQPKLDGRTKTSGIIMCDQAKILDLQVRNAEFIEKIPEDIILEIVGIISEIIEIESD